MMMKHCQIRGCHGPTSSLRQHKTTPIRHVRLCASSDTSTSASTAESQLGDAWDLLIDFNKRDIRGTTAPLVETPQKREKLRLAVLAAYNSPWIPAAWTPGPNSDVLIGICAGDVRMGVRALRDWSLALELPYLLPVCKETDVPSLADMKGGVYVKYNPKTKLCYLSRYTGNYRGVLIQLGQQQIGHLPLGLFDEERKNPEPELA